MLAGVDPDDESKRAIVHVKSNLAPKGQTIGYTLKPGEGLRWTGQSDLTAEKILGGIGAGEEETAGRREAIDFLREALQDGEREADEVTKQAERYGITKDRLRRARESLGIKPQRRGFGKDQKWFWNLPDRDTNESKVSTEMASPADSAISDQTIGTKASYGSSLIRDGNASSSAVSVSSQKPSQRLLENDKASLPPLPIHAIWCNAESDQPVTITDDLGIKAGKRWLKIKESLTGIPADEVFMEVGHA